MGKWRVNHRPLIGDDSATSGFDRLAFRQGANLAVSDLGSEVLSVHVFGHNNEDNSSFSQISSLNPKLIVRTATAKNDSLSSSTISAPVIALNSSDYSTSAKDFAFLPAESESLAAGINFAAKDKKQPVVLITPPGFSQKTLTNLKARLPSKQELVTLAYTDAESAERIAGRIVKKGPFAGIFAFAGNDPKAAAIAAALTKTKSKQSNRTYVGNSNWDSALISKTALNGAIIATLDTTNQSLMADRYQAKYGSPPSPSALHGYDLIAMASGIIRASGPDSLNRSALLSDTGFTGTAGSFRLRSNGTVERNLAIATIKNGALVQSQAPAQGF